MTDELKPLSPRLAELLRRESEAALPVRKGAEERLLGMLRIAGNLPTPGGGEGGDGGDGGGAGDAGGPVAPGGAQGAGGAGASGAGAGAASKAAGTWLAPKAVLLATATGALGFAGGLAVSPSAPPPAPSVSAPAVSQPLGAQEPDAESTHDAGHAQETPTDAGVSAARPRTPKRVKEPERPREVAPEPAPSPAQEQAPDVQQASERQLIDAARVALNRGRSHDALVFLMGHERRFPQGSFEEERELLIIEALVAQNRAAQATQRGKAFLSKFPRSTHAPRVRALVGAP